MVLIVNTNQNNNRRAGLGNLVVRGSWRLSFRNSKKNLGAASPSSQSRNDHRDDLCSTDIKERTESKHVTFPDDNDLVSVIPYDQTEQEALESWYQLDDYGRFQKDRVLTSFGYLSSRRIGGTDYDDHGHSTRGLELLCDARLGKKLIGEKKDLARGLREEEVRQKRVGDFPNLERFRAASLKCSKPSRDRAIALAQEDARIFRPKSKNLMVEALSRFRPRKRHSGGSGPGMPRRRSFG